MTCTNCKAEADQNYCANCGEPVHLKRITGHYIIHEIQHVIHFEKGLLYTVRELLLRPGQNVRHFIDENRSRLVKPIIFIVITSLIYTLIVHLFHIQEGYVKLEEEKKTATGLIFDWVQEHYGYANIIMGLFIALWARLFFRQYDYNYYEILILLCFVLGMSMLIFSLFALLQGLSHFDMTQPASVLGFGYCIWATGQFFDQKKVSNYFKASAAYLLGMISFVLTAFLLGAITDLVINGMK